MSQVLKLSRLAVAVVSAACATDAPDAPLVEVRDSAGIRIVENRVPEGVAPVYAELGEVELEIGVVEGEDAYQFTQVAAIRTMGEGRLLVAEANGLELRVFDAAGLHLRTLGRQGSGPGEFVRFTDVGVIGDTVWVFDSRQRRVTLFSSDGTLLDAERLGADQMPGGPEEHAWLLEDGSWLNLREIPKVDFGIRRSDAAFIRLPSELGPMDTVAVTPWQESFALRTSGGGIVIGGLPYARSTSIAVGPTFLVLGWNASYRLEYRGHDGVLGSVALAHDLERTLDPEEVNLRRRRRAESCRSDLCEEVDAFIYSDDSLPAVRPAFSDVVIDALDHVWVAEYEPPEDMPVTWHVFSPEGELMGRVAIPDGFTVHQVGDDYLLGVVKDDFDVPYVRRYGLVRMR